MADWNANQYLKFEDERTRPPRDLIAQIPLQQPERVIDLGCGPGNSTELLVARYPDAEVIGIGSSPSMLSRARSRLPKCSFIEADLTSWSPPAGTDLLFANASFQWLPDHPAALRGVVQQLRPCGAPRGSRPGGVLAVQMPDNMDEPALSLMSKVAGSGPWTGNPALASAAREPLPKPEGYYGLLKPLCAELDLWHIVYNHVMADHAAIVEWFKGSALR